MVALRCGEVTQRLLVRRYFQMFITLNWTILIGQLLFIDRGARGYCFYRAFSILRTQITVKMNGRAVSTIFNFTPL